MASQPNKHNSLAAFARQIGINEATARTWKRRGRIVSGETGFSVSTVSALPNVSSGLRIETLETELKRQLETLETENEALRAELARVTADRDKLRERCEFLSAREMALSSEVAGLILDGSPGYDIVECANMCDAVADQAQRIDDCVVDRAPDWGA